jgi:hypothetical protein
MATFPSMPHIAHASYGGSLNAVEKCHLPTKLFNSKERVLSPLIAKIHIKRDIEGK